jgi:serine/threonine protein phosphatase PrpC
MTLATEKQESPTTPVLLALPGASSQSIGSIAAVAEGSAAVAISQGGAKKRYPHTDPNEDAAGFALGERGVLLVVADGHNGRDAAEIAVNEILNRADGLFAKLAHAPIQEQWPAIAQEAVAAAQAAILAHVIQGGRDRTRTTLAVALVQPEDDLLAFASIGDSHIFRVGTDEVVDLAGDEGRPLYYLGDPSMDRDALSASCVAKVETLDGVLAVALATDGISEPGIGVDVPEFTVGECASIAVRAGAELQPLELARGIAEAALAAHREHRAGDNIATAVTLLPIIDSSSFDTSSVGR